MASQMPITATAGGDIVYFSCIFTQNGTAPQNYVHAHLSAVPGCAGRGQRSPPLKDSPGCGDKNAATPTPPPESRPPSSVPRASFPSFPCPRPPLGGRGPAARAVGEGAAAAVAEAGRRPWSGRADRSAGGAEHDVTPREDEAERCRGRRQRSASP